MKKNKDINVVKGKIYITYSFEDDEIDENLIGEELIEFIKNNMYDLKELKIEDIDVEIE